MPIVLLDLATNTKSNTAPEVHKTLYCELKQHYLHYQEIFTDGSKSTNQVCAATVFLSSKLAFSTTLPHTTSISTADLLGIQLALSNIHKTNCNFRILFSYSQSALQAINHNSSKNPIVLDILLKYNDLINYHYDVILCWIPGHVGIKGNIAADKLARVITHILPIPYSDIFSYSEKYYPFQVASHLGLLILITNYINYFRNSSTSHHYTNRILEKTRLS